MSRKKTAEQKLVEAAREMGIDQAIQILKSIGHFVQPNVPVKQKQRPDIKAV